jgi:hypothetical protein
MKINYFIPAILMSALLISCNNENKKDAETIDTQMSELAPLQNIKDDANQQIPVGTFEMPDTVAVDVPAQSTVKFNPDWDKKIIKTATLKLEISDHKKYTGFVHNAVKLHGAYIAQEEQNFADEKLETILTIKVPVAQFETIMNKLPGEDGKVLERKINTDDVTGEVVDTKARLEAKKQMRLKYLEFLKQSKNMAEVLQVQNEINSIQEEIESAAGRVAFLSHQSLYSTINLSFYQPMPGFTSADETPSFLKRITAAFKSGTSWTGDLLIGLISIWPLMLIFTVIYFVWRKLRPSGIIVQKS